ncbi:MAG: putative RNA-binding protein (virulence factor B family) [Oceanospirillaceae bacterium]
MIVIGKTNKLEVIREAEFGVYLEGGKYGGILLAKDEVPQSCTKGDVIEVFVYLDSDDYVVATTIKPLVQVNEFATLTVAEVNDVGAFLDWGLPKQLLVPYAEQRKTLEPGQRITVRVYLDNTDRIAASTKLDKFLKNDTADLQMGDEVQLFVVRKNELGFSVIVNDLYWAVLHAKDVFKTVRPGHKRKGYIKRVLDHDKIDVMLEKPGYAKVDALCQDILDDLEDRGGFSKLGDKSKPEDIYQQFGISKKSYKMALGTLKKMGKIEISKEGVSFVNE